MKINGNEAKKVLVGIPDFEKEIVFYAGSW